jgi:hypothetical protein
VNFHLHDDKYPTLTEAPETAMRQRLAADWVQPMGAVLERIRREEPDLDALDVVNLALLLVGLGGYDERPEWEALSEALRAGGDTWKAFVAAHPTTPEPGGQIPLTAPEVLRAAPRYVAEVAAVWRALLEAEVRRLASVAARIDQGERPTGAECAHVPMLTILGCALELAYLEEELKSLE